jgi:hypothetical protein
LEGWADSESSCRWKWNILYIYNSTKSWTCHYLTKNVNEITCSFSTLIILCKLINSGLALDLHLVKKSIAPKP